MSMTGYEVRRYFEGELLNPSTNKRAAGVTVVVEYCASCVIRTVPPTPATVRDLAEGYATMCDNCGRPIERRRPRA